MLSYCALYKAYNINYLQYKVTTVEERGHVPPTQREDDEVIVPGGQWPKDWCWAVVYILMGTRTSISRFRISRYFVLVRYSVVRYISDRWRCSMFLLSYVDVTTLLLVFPYLLFLEALICLDISFSNLVCATCLLYINVYVIV